MPAFSSLFSQTCDVGCHAILAQPTLGASSAVLLYRSIHESIKTSMIVKTDKTKLKDMD